MIWPSAIGARSTSMGTPAAIVEASGFICEISGTKVAAAPMAPTAPVATRRKSRRVGSAADMVVTVSVLSVSHTVRTTDPIEGRAPRRPSRRRRMRRYSGEYAALHHRVGLLAPLPAERKPANAANAGDLYQLLTGPDLFRASRGRGTVAHPT